jgi:hypothetical protein
MRKCIAVLTLAVWLTMAGSAAPAPERALQRDVSTVSATAEVIPGKPQVLVRIRNNNQVALDAWEIHLEYATPSAPNGRMDVAHDASDAADFARWQVPPKGTRERIYVVDGIPTNASVSVTMALFADLSREGKEDAVEFVLAEREKHAVTLTAWLDALQTTVGKTPHEAKMAIQAALRDDVRLSARSGDAFGKALRMNMSELIESGIGESVLSERLSALRRTFAEQRDRELRHKKR